MVFGKAFQVVRNRVDRVSCSARKSSCMEYDSFTDEVDNRERYARQAEEDARIQEHVNKELARRGE